MERKNQWFDEVKEDLGEYNLTDEQIDRIAADYELMAESARLAGKYCINYFCVGSTTIAEGVKGRYRHGSVTGSYGLLAEDIAIAMLNDTEIETVVTGAMRLYRRYSKIIKSEK